MIRPSPSFVAALAAAAWLVPASALAGDAAAGKKAYQDNCAICHGETGKGDGAGAPAPPLGPPRDFTMGDFKFDADGNGKPGEDADLELVITNGAAAYGGSPLMTTWSHLPEADIDNLVAYVRSLKK